MNSKCVAAVLSITLGLILCIPAEAQSYGKIVSNGTIAGAIVGIAAGVAVIVVVAVHYSKKRTITGCVHGQGSELTLTDEADKQTYALSGDTTGIKSGDRMKVHGKKVKTKGTNQPLTWQAKTVAKDFGVCQP